MGFFLIFFSFFNVTYNFQSVICQSHFFNGLKMAICQPYFYILFFFHFQKLKFINCNFYMALYLEF